jgi:translation initiation factor IF-2
MKVRSPVVTILGHVDHGKTTLLDYIRKSNLTKKEIGGITQRIGAYEIDTKIKGYPNSKITFIDTPGHEAFAKLRSRGANIADIALLLIDGKDGVMAQTIESIYHIKNANIPFVVVINKIDLPESQPEKIKNELIKYEVLVEDKGGKVPCLLISAKTGQGINDLLETILFIGAEKNLSFNPQSPPKVYIIEAKKDKAGILTSAIIKDGHLKVGDIFYENDKPKKIRAMFNDLGRGIKEVFPATPFVFLGYDELPEAGTLLSLTPQSTTQKEENVKKTVNVQEILQPKKEEKKLSLVLKADSYGSLEALTNALSNIKNCEIVLKGIGDINRSDIFLAKTTKAIVVGFLVRTSEEASILAKQEKIIIKTYQIIYDLLDELKEVSQLLQEKEQKEKSVKGEAKILATFIIEGEKVYGVSVIKGKINLGDPIEVYRNEKLLGKTKLVSLKIRAKRVLEVKKGEEAGMIFSPPLDITIGDVVKSIL